MAVSEVDREAQVPEKASLQAAIGGSQASCSLPGTKRNRMTGHSEHSRKDSRPDLSAQKPIINELLVTRAPGLTNVKIKHRRGEFDKGIDG